MKTENNIHEDWADYDNLKIRDGRDKNFFSCTENWEVDYLKEKIKKHYPQLDDQLINKAIQLCCSLYKGNHSREEFVDAVMLRLRI